MENKEWRVYNIVDFDYSVGKNIETGGVLEIPMNVIESFVSHKDHEIAIIKTIYGNEYIIRTYYKNK